MLLFIKTVLKNIKLKSSGGSSLLYRHKDAYVMLKDYIQLSKEELQAIETASAKIKIIGTRYTEAMEKATGL